eukprot:bmy_12318T0
MGEISVGVNPGALKLWGNGRRIDRSPEQPQGVIYLEKYSSTVQQLAYRVWHRVNRQEELLTGGGRREWTEEMFARGRVLAKQQKPSKAIAMKRPATEPIHHITYLLDTSLFLAITVIGITVLLLALKNKNVKKRHPITLQHPEAKFLLPLIEKEQISYNTRRFRFGLPLPDHAFGLPVGNYVNLLAKIDGVLVVRAYTPVSGDEDLGFVDLIMKVNDARHVQLPHRHKLVQEGGKMTQYLENMKIGDTILFQGPSGRLFYHGSGKLVKLLQTSDCEHQRGGKPGLPASCVPGITPMLQLICCITRKPSDKTRMSLVCANQTEEEILVSKELEEVARTHPKQFNLWYTLDRPPVGWKYSSGFITEDTIKEHLPPPGRFLFILACGPPPLIQRAAHPNLEKLGYTKDMIFTY